MSLNLAGQVIDRYQLLEVMGRGGMAVVYRARQLNIERDVAVKVMSSVLASSPDFITRFKREANLIAKLEHPQILPIYDYGQVGEFVYLVLRLMEGGSLDKHIRGKTLPLPEVEKLISQIASGLDYAHQHGIVHRDLKPNNVLLDNLGNAYLMDFGIAKIMQGVQMTATGTLMGTPAYMAPEQWKADSIDQRADIYSLGIILYELLTGDVPFHAETPHQFMFAHLEKEMPRASLKVPGLPAAIDKIILKATSKKPEDRYQKATDLTKAFSDAIKGQKQEDLRVADEATTILPAYLPPKSARNAALYRILPVCLIALIGVVVIAAWAILSGDGDDKNTNNDRGRQGQTEVALEAASIQSPSDTPSPTNSPSPTSEPTNTATNTPTNTAIATSSPTNTSTNTPTQHPSDTSTSTATDTSTNAPTATPSLTNTSTNTATPTYTPTNTLTSTPSPTNTPFPTATAIVVHGFQRITSNTQWQELGGPIEHDSGNGVIMVLVPAGCFRMGSSEAQREYAELLGAVLQYTEDEIPVREICFDEPFWIDKYEVTQADFDRLGGQAANESSFSGERHPQENVTWFEAQNFCNIQGGSLPTEAQWEYVARGPDNLIFPWGNEFVAANVAFFGNSNGQTAEVGSKVGGASWVGALDMSGNVWEWVSSLYLPYDSSEDPEDKSDITNLRVFRGGSATYDSDVRSTDRGSLNPEIWNLTIGFRCVRPYNGEFGWPTQPTE